ncbi:MAG: phosphoribosylformylglycinamidine cyclo-ligase [Leptonema sp. (in: Bacteria)]|nr:phosphoribosylformylglycinamidine cyclo-ligase [Leptonema sp. (in: bacteria)]
MSKAYKAAGVDTVAGQHFVDLIKPAVRSTQSSLVVGGLGGFSAIYDASFLKEYDHPLLVSSTDGVGTKLTLAQMLNRHNTIGLDLVAMCANDLLVCGAKAHFFLDYVAVGRLNPDQLTIVIESIALGCRLAECSLVGGETAEHPGVMKKDDYDLAGFVVGAVEKSVVESLNQIETGDIIIGIPSSGIHSNGVSLIRRLFLADGELPESNQEKSFLENQILLSPTVIYESVVRKIIDRSLSTGMAHITGGGFYENVPRVLAPNLRAEFKTWSLPEPFTTIQSKGNLSLQEMHSVFNCGYGYLVMVRPQNIDLALSEINEGLTNYRSKLKSEFEQTFPLFTDFQISESLKRPAQVIGEIKNRADNQPKIQFL